MKTQTERSLIEAPSFGQQRWWQISAQSEMKKNQEILILDFYPKQINRELLKDSIAFLYQRHESLRTVFPLENGRIRQKVLSANEPIFNLRYFDLSNLQEEAYTQVINDIKKISFHELQKGPVSKFLLIKFNDSLYNVCAILHHIIADAWSVNLLKSEILHVYNSLKNGREPTLAPLILQLRDFSALHNKRVLSKKIKDESYWKYKLEKHIPRECLSANNQAFAYAKPKNQLAFGYVTNFTNTVKDQISICCVKSKVGMSAFLYTSLALSCYITSTKEQLLFVSPITGRFENAARSLIGCLVGHVYLSIKINREMKIIDLIKQVYHEILTSSRHAIYGYEVLALNERALKEACQLYVNLEIEQTASRANLPLNLKEGFHKHIDLEFPLQCTVTEYADAFSFRWACNTASVSINYLKDIAVLHKKIVDFMIANPFCNIAHLKRNAI